MFYSYFCSNTFNNPAQCCHLRRLQLILSSGFKDSTKLRRLMPIEHLCVHGFSVVNIIQWYVRPLALQYVTLLAFPFQGQPSKHPSADRHIRDTERILHHPGAVSVSS